MAIIKSPLPLSRILAAIWLISGPTLIHAQAPPPGKTSPSEFRLQVLEDREQIRQLLHRYGRYLDERNFPAFADLFAETDSEYVSGNQTAHGAQTIGAMLEEIIKANPSGFKTPNFHVFFNEIIEINGDQAMAFSQSAYIVPGVNGKPEMVFFATYDDVFIREQGRWKFKRRAVRGDIPSR